MGNPDWSTNDEMIYLRELATEKVWKRCEFYKRKHDTSWLLQNYIKNAIKRKRYGTWGHVNANKVISTARAYLEVME